MVSDKNAAIPNIPIQEPKPLEEDKDLIKVL